LRLPFGFESGAELVVILVVLAGEEKAAGAEDVGDSVEAGRSLPRGSSWSRGVLGIPQIGLMLIVGNQHGEIHPSI